MSGKQWALLCGAVACLAAIVAIAPPFLLEEHDPPRHDLPLGLLALALLTVAALAAAVWVVRLGPRTTGSIACSSMVLLLALVVAYAIARVAAHPMPPDRWRCVSNLKQLTLGSLMYAQDYDDKLPLVGGWPVLLNPYLKNYYLLRCPQDERPAGTSFAAPGWPEDGWLSYGADVRLGGEKLGRIPHQDKAMWLFDCDTSVGLPGMAAWRHNDAANFAFADGHVRRLKPEEVRAKAK